MGTITYQTGTRTINYVYRATSGGTVFSSNLNATAAFDYFDDTAVVDDAIYIGVTSATSLSKIVFRVGTAFVGNGAVLQWEFYQRDLSVSPFYGGNGTVEGWYPMTMCSDETNGFTTTGSKSFKFGLQYGQLFTTINSVSAMWVRCRVVSVAYTTGAAVFTGAGLNDATFSGTYTGTGNSESFTVEIDGTGTPDTFKWKKGAGAWTTGVAITGSAQLLSDGISVTFAATTGHTATDNWVTTITSITEGGANATSTVAGYDAEVNVDGYTDGSPCTLADISAYLDTNAPWLGVTRMNRYYNFNSVCLDFNSRVYSQRETLEFGFFGSGTYNGDYDLSYLQMGDKVGTSFGKNGGVLIVNQSTNSWRGTIATTTYFYGTTILVSIGGPGAGGWGYQGWQAETLGCSLLNFNPTPNNYGIISNCFINHGSTWIVQAGWFGVFNDNKVVIPNEGSGFQALGLFYNAGFTAKNLDYQFTVTSGATAGYMIYFYNSSANSNVEWTFIDTKTPLPARGTSSTYPRTFYRSSSAAGNWGKVWKYDDSAGTYTDITTAASSTVATNDVDMSGDVGDIIYLGMAATFLGRWHEITSTNGANDYEYAYEYYTGATGGWQEMEYVWDGAENFSKTGNQFFSRKTPFLELATLTVNGYAGFWHRIRITKKGTGTPKISMFRGGSEAGHGLWNAYEKYTISTKVVDKDGSPIEGATVSISLDGTLKTTGTTDSDGVPTFVGDELVNVLLNSYLNPFETFVTSGRDITSAINTSSYGISGVPRIVNFEVGKTYRLSYNLTLNSGTAPTFNIMSNINSGTLLQTIGVTSAGQQTLDFVSTVNGSWYLELRVGNGVATNFSMTDISLKEVSTSYPCTYRRWYFDPLNVTTTNLRIAEDTSNAYDLKITADGYETYTSKLTMNAKKDLVIELKDAISTMTSTDSRIAVKLDPTNSGVNRDKVIVV